MLKKYTPRYFIATLLLTLFSFSSVAAEPSTYKNRSLTEQQVLGAVSLVKDFFQYIEDNQINLSELENDEDDDLDFFELDKESSGEYDFLQGLEQSFFAVGAYQDLLSVLGDKELKQLLKKHQFDDGDELTFALSKLLAGSYFLKYDDILAELLDGLDELNLPENIVQLLRERKYSEIENLEIFKEEQESTFNPEALALGFALLPFTMMQSMYEIAESQLTEQDKAVLSKHKNTVLEFIELMDNDDDSW